MLISKVKSLVFSLICLVLSNCTKHEPLPELGMGNEINPIANIEFVKLDSTRIYTTSSKYLKSYVGLNTTLVAKNGFVISKINVYKNGVNGTFLIPPLNSFLMSVVSGQIIKFEFTLVDSQGRESKKSIPYSITIP